MARTFYIIVKKRNLIIATTITIITTNIISRIKNIILLIIIHTIYINMRILYLEMVIRVLILVLVPGLVLLILKILKWPGKLLSIIASKETFFCFTIILFCFIYWCFVIFFLFLLPYCPIYCPLPQSFLTLVVTPSILTNVINFDLILTDLIEWNQFRSVRLCQTCCRREHEEHVVASTGQVR